MQTGNDIEKATGCGTTCGFNALSITDEMVFGLNLVGKTVIIIDGQFALGQALKYFPK